MRSRSLLQTLLSIAIKIAQLASCQDNPQVLYTCTFHLQVEVDYQGGGTYKRKYRVREIIPKGPFDLMFKNEQVQHAVV